MFENIYAWLLRLYPSRFRSEYGEEIVQLFRDRTRDEKGFFQRLRLWLDLVADLAISVPREYYYFEPELIGASADQRLGGLPSFVVIEGGSPRPGALFSGGVLTILVLSTCSIFLSQAGTTGPGGLSPQPHRKVTDIRILLHLGDRHLLQAMKEETARRRSDGRL